MTRNPNKVVLLFAGILSAYAIGFWLYSPSQPALSFAATDNVPAPAGPAPAGLAPTTPGTDGQPDSDIDPVDLPAEPEPILMTGPGEKRVVAPEFTSYTLVAGDTSFAAISRRVYGTARHAEAISRANAFASPHRLRVGQTIRIPKDPTNISGRIEVVPTVVEATPPREARPVASPSTPLLGGAPQIGQPIDPATGLPMSKPLPAPDAPVPGTPERIHTVQRGETLSDIAVRYYGSAARWKRILDANSNVLSRPERIKPGMKLVIPD
jgi:nucleoid-associated protein YgaU